MTDSIFPAWHSTGVWETTKYRGRICQQSPCDLWSLQEIIFETRPKTILQIGVADGGTVLWMSDILAKIRNDGLVIGIDIAEMKQPIYRDDIKLIQGNSIDSDVIKLIYRYFKGTDGMVVIDGDHRKKQVLKELNAYAGLVSKGNYLIVEDTCIGKLCCMDYGPGPAEALKEWFPSHSEFQIDHTRTRWGLSQHPGGYLKRVST